jgi:hypothetical protein
LALKRQSSTDALAGDQDAFQALYPLSSRGSGLLPDVPPERNRD